MSLVNAPSKEEVLGWNTQTLADYMRRLNLSSCDNVVLQSSITGEQFMRMTPSQLQVFPSLYLPILTNIQRGGEQKTFGPKSTTQKTPKKVFKQDEEVWKSDEFSSESDHDYEFPEKKTGEENYICHITEQQTAEKRYNKKANEENDTLQPWEVSVKPPQSLRVQDCHREGSIFMASGSSLSHFPQSRAPLPTDVFKRSSKVPPVPPMPTEPPKLNKAIPEPKKCLDPSWYRGNVTRREAEAALRAVNKDGAFIVRDSSEGSAEHPHTLMLLNQGKVYNIRICRQGNSYLLGNGLNSTQSFPGVTEVIIHHMNTPLVLINATDKRSAEKSQCCLLYPAGL